MEILKEKMIISSGLYIVWLFNSLLNGCEFLLLIGWIFFVVG